ncbi:MAG: asparagine synthase (glutamine-hydrolyzing) [Salibacteraceae bacterium]
MCGFAGIVTASSLPSEAELRAAGDLIRHRGPDHQGIFRQESQGLGLVHQRLSILALDPRSHQPFFSPDGRFVLVFNGEIYNYREIREGLVRDGAVCQTESDTEVLLQLLMQRGKAALEALNGMFAFAFWDSQEQQLLIARDRLGIKPLYYFHREGTIAFTSDLKAFQAWECIPKTIDPQSIWQYLFYGYVPLDRSIYQSVQKLKPGHLIEWQPGSTCQTARWWNPQAAPKPDRVDAHSVRDLLGNSIAQRLISDVKVGAFASGGLDSSGILSYLQKAQIETFTIGFEHQSNTLDIQRSKELSARYNIPQTLTILGEESLEGFNHFLELMDEPLSEASILPLYHNYRIAKAHGAKVILSGDGADEVWGGYQYFQGIQRQPSLRQYSFLYGLGYPLVRGMLGFLKANSKAGKFRDLYLLNFLQNLSHASMGAAHSFQVSQKNRDDLQQLSSGKITSLIDPLMEQLYREKDLDWQAMLSVETETVLVNKHLAKVDKASMANSIEARVPYLDHRLVEAAQHATQADRTGKQLLKQALAPQLPNNIIQDRKRGFNLPLKAWVKAYITKAGANHLDKQSLEALGIISMPALDHLIQVHRNGYRDHSRTLWSLYVLSRWLQHNAWQLS